MNKINNYNIINDINFDKNNIINQENLHSQNNDEFKYIFNSIINKKIDNNNISVDDNEKDKQIINYDSKNFLMILIPLSLKKKKIIQL